MRDSRIQDSRTREFRPQDSLANRVGKLFRVMARVHNRALKPLEISAVQAHILATLWLKGAMTIGELQAALALGSSTLTGAIDRMEKAQLVRRAPVPGDRRAYRLEPAAWPARKKEALFGTLQAADDECFAALSAAERRELGRLLDKALGGLVEATPDDDE